MRGSARESALRPDRQCRALPGGKRGSKLAAGEPAPAVGAAILALAACMIAGIWELRNDCTRVRPDEFSLDIGEAGQG